MFIVIIFWIIMGLIASHFAAKRGRDPVAWFFIGALFGLISLLVLFILPPLMKDSIQVTNDLEIKPTSVVNLPINYQTKEWFYLNKNQDQIGPVSFEALMGLIKEGSVNNQTYIWCEGMSDWEKTEFLGDITSLL